MTRSVKRLLEDASAAHEAPQLRQSCRTADATLPGVIAHRISMRCRPVLLTLLLLLLLILLDCCLFNSMLSMSLPLLLLLLLSPCRLCIVPAAAPRPCTPPPPAHRGPPGCQHCSSTTARPRFRLCVTQK
jgi:hypothetical protein